MKKLILAFFLILTLIVACGEVELPLSGAPTTVEVPFEEQPAIEQPAQADFQEILEERNKAQEATEEPEEVTEVKEIPEQHQEAFVVQPSITEEYLETFRNKVQYYAFDYERDDYEEMLVFVKDDTIVVESYTVWLLDRTTGRIMHMDEAEALSDKELYAGLDDGKYAIIDYVWYVNEVRYACLIDSARASYNSEDCQTWADSEERAIFTYVRFKPTLMLPEDWLEKFSGEAPIKVETGHSYLDRYQETEHIVDHLIFENYDGTVTKLYIHTSFKIPLKVEILKDKTVIETHHYNHFTINKPGTKRWNPEFLEP